MEIINKNVFSLKLNFNYSFEMLMFLKGQYFLFSDTNFENWLATGIYMLKVNSKDTRTYFIPCSTVSIVDFEYVIAGWDRGTRIAALFKS